jgi:acetylornithine deacetylase/succinyl-diaminopimelate desuccinylase-like protein
MKVIKDMSEDIEETLDMAECNIKKAIEYKLDYPLASQAFYNKSVALMSTIKGQHDAVVTLIEGYRKEKGEPPEPMMAIYNYLHERHINLSAAIKNLQDMYIK